MSTANIAQRKLKKVQVNARNDKRGNSVGHKLLVLFKVNVCFKLAHIHDVIFLSLYSILVLQIAKLRRELK